METSIVKTIIGVVLLSGLASCGDTLSDTYKWAENQGLFSAARWSFVQAPATDVYVWEQTLKHPLKNPGVNPSYTYKLYNNSLSAPEMMVVDFTNGTLTVDESPVTNGAPFSVAGKTILNVVFSPNVFPDKSVRSTAPMIYTISSHSYADGLEKSVTLYTLKLFANDAPIAAFTELRREALYYTFDASASIDGDQSLGGGIEAYTYVVTEIISNASQSFTVDSTKKVVTYAFPNEGQYTVKLTVYDKDGGMSSIEKTITVN